MFNLIRLSKSVSILALHMGSSKLLCLRLDSSVGRSVPPLNSSHYVPASTNSVVAADPFTREVEAPTKVLVKFEISNKRLWICSVITLQKAQSFALRLYHWFCLVFNITSVNSTSLYTICNIWLERTSLHGETYFFTQPQLSVELFFRKAHFKCSF